MDKKKVGIVSCYFQPNYGSMLQAYATQMALDRMGIENETINIDGLNHEIKKAKSKYFIKAALTSDILLSKMGMVKNRVRRKLSRGSYGADSARRNRRFKKFEKKMFRVSEKYGSLAELSAKCAENYSSVLVGSDQLWLPGNVSADYYTLSFVPESVNSIAYSTSFGQSELPRDIEKKARVFLRRIRHLSIREKSGQKLIYKLTGRKVPVVCDPTLLFDGDEWMQIQKKERLVKEPYIFCYFLGKNMKCRDFATKLKAETGYKIVALTHLDEYVKADEVYADIKPYDVDPADFINLIRNAEYVCTDSFHCSVFSILYNKLFFTFRRYTKKTKSSTNTRLDTLFDMLGVEGRLLTGDESVRECMARTIDFDKIHNRLKKVRKKSLDYLKASLEDERNTDL